MGPHRRIEDLIHIHFPNSYYFVFNGIGVDWAGMDFHQISKEFHSLWDSQPVAIILLALGFLVFLFLVVDAWRHKRRRKKPRLH
jgi:hypothetical protein